MAVGRISGPLLKANLLRDGVDLAFETNLLYLDVVNGKVCINKFPDLLTDYDLDVNGTTKTTNIEVTTQADIAELTVTGNTISSTNGTINLEPAGTEPVVYQAKLVLDDLQISTNTIEVTTTDTDLVFETLGTGKVNVNSDMYVSGDLHVVGNITADGDIGGTINIGDSNTDNVVFNADVNSDIIPDDHNTWDLGTITPSVGFPDGKRWRTVYTNTISTTDVTATNLTVTNDLDVSGTVLLNGDVTIGTNATDTLSFPGTISGNLIPTANAFYDIGSDSSRWDNVYVSRIEVDGLVIDNNQIATTLNNDNLTLTASGTGKIYVPTNNVEIDQSLTVTGDTYLHGTTITGNVTHTGDVTQTGDYTQTGDTDITGNLTVSTFAQFEKIRIDGNTVSTTATDTNLQLEASGTGKIYVPSDDVQFDQTLTVDGIATINELSVTNGITANSFSTGDILISGNSITTQLTDHDLELTANGTGKVVVPTNNVEFSQDLTVGGDLTVTTGTTYLAGVDVTGNITQAGDINQTGDFTTSGTTEVTGNIVGTGTLELGDITISGHLIEVTTTDTDLELRPNGLGDVVFEDIRVANNTFKSTQLNQDIILQPNGSGSVLINSNQSLIIPVGTTAERPATGTEEFGMIRYNSTLSQYEGWVGTYWLKLSGVQDLDNNTYITPELTPGANDNVLRFYANNTLTVTIDSTKLFAERMQTAGLDVNGNTISALTTDTDVNLTTTGTGGVKVGNLKIRNNTITNTSTGAVTEFAETGTGYVKISGTNGVVIPTGDQTQLPLAPETGMIRFNTFYQYVEVFNGLTWVNVAGSASGVSLAQATEIGILSALLFG